MISANNLDFDIFDAILNFYGDNIQYELWQIEKIVHKFTSKNDYNGEFNWKSNPTIFEFINRILDIKCIDSRIFDNNNNSIIMCACKANDYDLVKKLLKLDNINVNLYDSDTGNTPLLVSVQNGNYDISKLLINYPKTNINAKNFENQTALIIAVQKHMDEIVDILLKNDKFDANESLLNYAFTISTEETTEFFNNLDIIDVNDNSSFDDNRTLLIHAVEVNSKEMVELIINHRSFDKKKSRLYEAIFRASFHNEIEIFKILIKLIDDDFKDYKYLGRNILSFLPKLKRQSNNLGHHYEIDDVINENDNINNFCNYNTININNFCNYNTNNEIENNDYMITEVLNNIDLGLEKKGSFVNNQINFSSSISTTSQFSFSGNFGNTNLNQVGNSMLNGFGTNSSNSTKAEFSSTNTSNSTSLSSNALPSIGTASQQWSSFNFQNFNSSNQSVNNNPSNSGDNSSKALGDGLTGTTTNNLTNAFGNTSSSFSTSSQKSFSFNFPGFNLSNQSVNNNPNNNENNSSKASGDVLSGTTTNNLTNAFGNSSSFSSTSSQKSFSFNFPGFNLSNQSVNNNPSNCGDNSSKAPGDVLNGTTTNNLTNAFGNSSSSFNTSSQKSFSFNSSSPNSLSSFNFGCKDATAPLSSSSLLILNNPDASHPVTSSQITATTSNGIDVSNDHKNEDKTRKHLSISEANYMFISVDHNDPKSSNSIPSGLHD